MISENFNRFMDIYNLNQNRNTDSKTETHKLITGVIPDSLSQRFPQYYIKGSEGVGQRTFYPWICLMDTNITRTPQKGLYIGILFKRDMTGFYVTLNQGITYFEKTFGKEKYLKAVEAADYFRSEIVVPREEIGIDVGGIRGDNGYGFEKTTICAKLFEKNKFNDDELLETIDKYSSLYDEIISTIDGYSYETIIPKIINDPSSRFVPAEQAINEIKQVINEGHNPIRQKLVEVKPNVDKVKRFREITKPSNNKVDYVKRARENAETGLLGEKLILEFEIDRLNKLGLDEYAKKVEHVALNNDVLGYDIKSYNAKDDGTIEEIYIEVKTSSTPKDVDFYVSRNEVEQSKKLDSQYWLYRVYNCSSASQNPKFYRTNGAIDKNFELTADTYKATLKKDANIVSSTIEINKSIFREIEEFVS